MRHSPSYLRLTAHTDLNGSLDWLSLEEQKLVTSAKDILMRQRNLSEREAYQLLYEMAEKRKTGLAEIAQQLVTISSRLTV